jgi:hypothetical protein
MSLKHNQQKIKPILGILILIEFLVISYLSIEIYRICNVNSNIVFLSQHFGVALRENSIGGNELGRGEMVDFYITASKNGTKYYYQNCSGVSRIKVENRIYFESEDEAQKAGYALANNCQK